MSKELMEHYRLKIGQKVLYLYSYPEIVTIKDIVTNYQDEIVVLVNEYDGYLNLSDIYTETQIYKMFNPYNQPSKHKGVWKYAHELAELVVESNWDSIKLINLLVDKIGEVRALDLINEAIEKKKGEKRNE